MAKSKVKNTKVYKQGQLYAPVYDIWIGGKKLGIAKKQCVTSIEITETVEGSDSATIRISDPDFVFINDSIYVENKKVKISMGFAGYTYRVKFNGYISAIDMDFPDTGVPTLTITCMDNTYKMNKKEKNKTYKKKTSAQIVKKICRKYGFKCVIEKGYKFKKQTITQSNQTDIAFLTKLAGDEVYPFTARLVGNTFYYIKMGKLKKKSEQELHYREYPNEIISFSPRINTTTKETNTGSTSKKKKSSSTSTGSVSGSKDTNTSGTTTKKTGTSGGRTYNPKTGKWTKN